MAYLNVRERKVETKIAYVGAVGAGKATNLEQLALRETPQRALARVVADDTGELLTLDWTATAASHFRDCAVSVKVVAACGVPSPERTRAMIRDADGVVLVLDASPEAAEDNRAAATIVREAVAARRALPVVVQINKTDLTDALAPDEVAGAIGVAWPHVGAAALHGDGVVETLERALADVLTALEAEAEASDVDTLRPAGEKGRGEGNPLLAALRQVLRETVSEHVSALEARFVERLEIALARTKDDSEIVALRKSFVDESARTRAALEEATGRLDRAKDEIRGEVLRAVEARSRADREHAAATALPIRRGVEALATDLRQIDVRSRLAELGDAVVAVQGRVDAVAPAVDKAVQREARDAVLRRLDAVEQSMRATVSDAAKAATHVDEQIAALRGQITELVEELKRKEKKGWFG